MTKSNSRFIIIVMDRGECHQIEEIHTQICGSIHLCAFKLNCHMQIEFVAVNDFTSKYSDHPKMGRTFTQES